MRRFLIVGLLNLMLPACSGEDPWQPDTNIPHTDVYIANFSAERILEVYVRSAGDTDWGETRLAAPVAAGDLYSFLAELTSATYDFRLVGELSTEEVLGIACFGDYIAIGFHGRTAAGLLSGAAGGAHRV